MPGYQCKFKTQYLLKYLLHVALEIVLSEITVDLFIFAEIFEAQFIVIDLNEGKNLTLLLSPLNF